MIRVAVFLAALAHMPLLAWSQQPTAQPPAMQVADSYYLKRQAKLAVAAGNDSPSAVPGAQDQANAVIERTAATDTSGPRLVAAPTMGADPYYAQRQAVAVATSMRRRKATSSAKPSSNRFPPRKLKSRKKPVTATAAVPTVVSPANAARTGQPSRAEVKIARDVAGY